MLYAQVLLNLDLNTLRAGTTSWKTCYFLIEADHKKMQGTSSRQKFLWLSEQSKELHPKQPIGYDGKDILCMNGRVF